MTYTPEDFQKCRSKLYELREHFPEHGYSMRHTPGEGFTIVAWDGTVVWSDSDPVDASQMPFGFTSAAVKTRYR